MTQDNANPTPDADIQFDRAEYATATQSAAVCGACKQPIADVYYTVGQTAFCPHCRDLVAAQLAGGSRAGRFFRALGLGLAAALVGSVLWFAVRKLTGYEVGLVAVAVGLLVGGAVKRGSGARGGWFYQSMAILLTYSAIVSQYVPDIFQMLMQEVGSRQQQVAATQPAAASADATTRSSDGSTVAPQPTDERERPGAWRVAGALAVIGLVVFAIAFAAPVLAGFQNLIGLLIIGFALYEAWKLNKRLQISFAGPFSVAPPPQGAPTA